MFSLPAWMPGRELRQGDGDDVAEEGAAAHGRSQDPNGSLANRQQRPFGPPSWRERPIASAVRRAENADRRPVCMSRRDARVTDPL